MEIIIREGKREKRERVFGRVSRDPKFAALNAAEARNCEEAADIAYHELEHGPEPWTKPIVVQGGPEARQAMIDDAKRLGVDPERYLRDQGVD